MDESKIKSERKMPAKPCFNVLDYSSMKNTLLCACECVIACLLYACVCVRCNMSHSNPVKLSTSMVSLRLSHV